MKIVYSRGLITVFVLVMALGLIVVTTKQKAIGGFFNETGKRQLRPLVNQR